MLYRHHQRSSPPLEVLSKTQLGDDSYQFSLYADADWNVFATHRTALDPAGPSRLLALPSQGGSLSALMTLQQPTDRFIAISAPAFDPGSGGLWFMAEVATGAGLVRSLSRALLPAPANLVLSSVPRPTSNAVALGTNYLVAHTDGIYSYTSVGGARLFTAVNVTALAASNDEVVFGSCDPPEFSCSLYRYDRATLVTRTLFTIVATAEDEFLSIALLGGQAYALSGRKLIRVSLSGGPLEELFAGRLASTSLRVVAGKLTFGSMCDFTPAAVGYGTMEVDPVGRTARWLNLEPDFPLVEGVTPFRGGPASPTITSLGIYAWLIR